jgi:hypothetical protein
LSALAKAASMSPPAIAHSCVLLVPNCSQTSGEPSVVDAVAVGADHDRDRVADVLDGALGQWPVLRGLDLHAGGRPDHRHGSREVAGQVVVGVDADDVGALLGRRLVDRHDSRVRLGGADQRGPDRAHRRVVVDVVAAPGDQARVLLALHGLPDEGAHAGTPFSAAVLTASTMLW